MSAVNTLTPRVSGVYFLKSGQQRDSFGLQDLHPNSNINKLEVYLEDGDDKNTVFINFRNDKKSAITSHWFPTIFMGYVNHTLIGETIPRTFAKYVMFVSTMVLKWNLNGHAPLPISATVVQTGGDRLIGLFETLNDLNNEYNQSQKEELYLNNKVAYVYGEDGEYGFYKLELDQSNYVWTKIDNPLDAYNIVDTKQYNILGLTIQKGNAPTVKSQITISDEYIRFMLSTLAEIKDSVIFVENELGDKDGGAVGNTVWGEINYLLFWVNKIMTDSSNISYDNQDSGLTATNIQDAIDELENIMFKKDGSVKATGDFDLNNKGIYDVSQISVGEINAQTQGGFIDVNDEMRFYDKTIGREGASDYEFVVKKQLDTELSKKLDKSGGTMTGDLDMNGNDISYVKELQVEKVTTGGGYSIGIEDDIDMRDNIIENVDIVKFAYGLQIQRSADKKEIRFYVPRTGGYGLIFKIVDGELRLHDGVKITNLADGTHIKDAVTKGQLDLKADQSTTYTKNEVNNLISQIPKFKIIKVSVLPTENIDLMAIYVLGDAEYIYIENETRWEKLGTLEVDLNDYFTKTEINSMIDDKVDKNANITAGTHPKITYDAKGLVTGGGALVAGDIPNLDAGKITSGTFADARIPSLDASKIISGTFDAARIPNLSISKITSLQATLDTIETSKQDKLVAGENIIIDENTNTISASGSYININYADLVALRDSNSLKEGAFYRITDYETTTTQVETRSAGNLFDIIVQALDNKTLSENAQAIHSERDVSGYFSGVDLGGWKLKYTLDNDSDMYYWADTVNGKGVIYKMVDEFENDLPYDFKNIQFKRYIIDEYPKNTELEGRYYALKDLNSNAVPNGATVDDNDFIWAYTFTVIDENGVVNDVSLNKNKTFLSDEETYYYTKNNKIGSFSYDYYDEIEEISKRKEALGNNVILYDYDYYGYWEFYGFYSNTIGNDFYSNTIGNNFRSNTIGNYFNYNTTGNGFYSNTIGNDFYSNTIGRDFYSNTIGNYFYYNTTGNGFYSNTIGNGFYSNTIGYGFNYNTIGNSFHSNTIGNYFYYNTTGNGFYSNTIGNDFYSNTIGNGFNYNTIGNGFYSNTIGNDIRFIQFSVDGTSSSRIRSLYIRSGLQGASLANKLDLYYSGLYHRTYPTYIERIANGNIVSIHQETPLVWAGKKKITNTSSTWEDI